MKKPCEGCQKIFEFRGYKKFCTVDCRKVSYSKLIKREVTQKSCVNCGSIFEVPDGGHKNATLYCSVDCKGMVRRVEVDDIENIRQCITYNADTGEMFRKRKNGGVVIAGCIGADGYIGLSVLGKTIKAHKLAYLLMTGETVPKGFQVDHINRVKTDNRWCNLRLATDSQNKANKDKQNNNTSGYKGVYWVKDKRKWKAYIECERKCIHLGYFETKEEAAEVYNKAAIELFGEFAFLNEIENKHICYYLPRRGL